MQSMEIILEIRRSRTQARLKEILPNFALIFVDELTAHRNSGASFLDRNSRMQMYHHDPEVTVMLFVVLRLRFGWVRE